MTQRPTASGTGVLSLETPMAIDELIVMGAQAVPELPQEEADAHHKGIDSTSGSSGIASKVYRDGVIATLDLVFTSLPKSTVMDCTLGITVTDAGVLRTWSPW